MTPEGRVSADIRKALKRQGVRFIRLALQPGVEAGWPDFEVLIPGGRPLLIEAKRPEYRLRADGGRSVKQQLRHDELRELGYDVCTAYSADEAIGAVLAALDSRALSAPG